MNCDFKIRILILNFEIEYAHERRGISLSTEPLYAVIGMLYCLPAKSQDLLLTIQVRF